MIWFTIHSKFQVGRKIKRAVILDFKFLLREMSKTDPAFTLHPLIEFIHKNKIHVYGL